MKRLVWSALAVTVVLLAACDGSTPTTAIPAATHAVGIVPADPLEPWVEPTDSTTYPPADTAATAP